MLINVKETIEFLVEEYYREFRKKPVGIVLGPDQYLELCEYLQRTDPALIQARVNQVIITEYRGYPVYVKEMPGIDLIIPYTEVSKYLK